MIAVGPLDCGDVNEECQRLLAVPYDEDGFGSGDGDAWAFFLSLCGLNWSGQKSGAHKTRVIS